MFGWALWNARNMFYFWGETASPKLGSRYGQSTATRLWGEEERHPAWVQVIVLWFYLSGLSRLIYQTKSFSGFMCCSMLLYIINCYLSLCIFLKVNKKIKSVNFYPFFSILRCTKHCKIKIFSYKYFTCKIFYLYKYFTSKQMEF